MNQDDIKICRKIATTVFENVDRLLDGQVGNPEAGQIVKIGADGTPTSSIDIIAENEVIKLLKDSEFESYLISEEIGELRLGKGNQKSVSLSEELLNSEDAEEKPRYIFLIDPLDGTSNAVKNIPAYGMSIAVARVPDGREATLEDVELGFVKNYSNGNYYEAIKGQGAKFCKPAIDYIGESDQFTNVKRNIVEEPLKPSQETDISQITLGGFTKSKTLSVSKLVDTARRMRVLGSVVLELAYIAFDANSALF